MYMCVCVCGCLCLKTILDMLKKIQFKFNLFGAFDIACMGKLKR